MSEPRPLDEETTQEHSQAGAEPPGAASERPAPGQVLAGRYTVLELLGQGGLGVVVAAYDARLDRRVALKLLHSQGDNTHALQLRLLREAQALARLNHPHVVQVYDSGTLEDGRLFIAMEYVRGQTLRAWCRQEPRPWRQVLEAYVAAGKGLAAAHAAGLVHRDFKPDNVLVGLDGRVRVTDFGMARATPAPPGTAPTPTPGSWERALTEPGSMLGTPRYMAPEVLAGEPADARSDLFAFCVALWEALFRQPPYPGGSLQERMQALATGEVAPPPPGSGVPGRVVRALRAGLQVDPRRRPASLEALLQHLAYDSARARTRWLVGAGVLALVLGVGAQALAAWRVRSAERAQLCQGAPLRLAGVWDEAVQARVQQAFAALPKPHAQAALAPVQQALGAYAQEWAAQYRQACEATRLRGEQTEQVLTLRMACLERRLRELEALGQVLAQADEAVARQAAQAAQDLPAPRGCAHVEALLAEPPLPAEEPTRRAWEELRQDLARVQALTLSGRQAQAAEAARAAVARARALGSSPVLAEALLSLAHATARSHPSQAVEAFSEAAHTALAHRMDRLAAEASVYATKLLSLSLQQAPASWWQAHAAALLARLPGQWELESVLANAEGAHHLVQGQPAQALQAYERAWHLMQRALGPEHWRTAQAEDNLATALEAAGRPAQALAHSRHAATLLQQSLGPRHPLLAYSWMRALRRQVPHGELAEASRVLEQVASILHESEPPGAVSLRLWRELAADVALVQGRYAQAQEHAQALLTLAPAGSDSAASALRVLGRVHLRQGRPRQAQQLLEQALRQYGESPPPPLELVDFQLALAEAHEAQGRAAQAQRLREALLREALRASGEGSLAVADLRLEVAAGLLHQGQAEQALALARQGHAVLVEQRGPQALRVADSWQLQGEALLALGQAAQARPLLEQALHLAEPQGVDPSLLTRRRELLARAR